MCESERERPALCKIRKMGPKDTRSLFIDKQECITKARQISSATGPGEVTQIERNVKYELQGGKVCVHNYMFK